MRWKHAVNDILKQHWQKVQQLPLNTYQLLHLNNLRKCGTEELGGQLLSCKACKHLQYIYHSCRNRHCPSCQGKRREQWIAKQQEYLLDVPYFHVVFTMPHELNPLCLSHPRLIYNLLFQASWQTIKTLSEDSKFLGANPGMTAVLHTWSQNLGLHPHLHCIIPAGGVDDNMEWINTRAKGKYLFPAKVMAAVYKGIFLKGLKELVSSNAISFDQELKEKLYAKNWVAYAKKPFLKPIHVIEYLGRYTHKIAISNYRLINIDENSVQFSWKNYRLGGQTKIMTLSIEEFIRRFALHILPHRFVRIRHFGILSFHGRSKTIPIIQHKQGFTPTIEFVVEPVVKSKPCCTKCKSNDISITILPRKIRDP